MNLVSEGCCFFLMLGRGCTRLAGNSFHKVFILLEVVGVLVPLGRHVPFVHRVSLGGFFRQLRSSAGS